MTEEVLGTRRLSKRFKGFTAVDNVDLSVKKGHIHALIHQPQHAARADHVVRIVKKIQIGRPLQNAVCHLAPFGK